MSDQAKNYHRIKKQFFYLSLGMDAAFLLAVQLAGISVWWRETAALVNPAPLVVNAIYSLGFFLAFFFWQLPLSFFSGYALEHRYNLSTQQFPGWVWDEIKKGLLSGLFFLIIVTAVYFLIARFPQNWWALAAVFWLLLSLGIARIMPDFIIPLFFKYKKVENEDLRQTVFALFKKCGVAISDVYAIDLSAKTKKANAFVCGLGKSRRVVLGDTLLADFTVSEIETVVAHELGHYKNQDILKLTIVNTVMIFASFYLVDIALEKIAVYLGLAKTDIAALPSFILVMIIFSLFTAPVLNGYSRLLETQADEFSLRVTGRREEFISMMHKLAGMNLAEYAPSRFDEIMFYDHPPVGKRIELAQNCKLADCNSQISN